MKAISDLLVYTLGPALYVLLLGGAVLGVIVGILLLVDSARVLRWNERLNRWFSTGNALRALDRPVEVKRAVYRWHRVIGVLVLGGSVFTLDALMFGFTTGAVVRAFRGGGSSSATLMSLGFETLRIFLIVGNVAALFAALVLVFRPSLLKGIEGWADRSYGSNPEKFEQMRYQPDEMVRAKPRLTGILVLLGSLYTLFGLGLLLR